MPFFAKYKILFIHIPKTGGTSVEQYLSTKTNTKLDIDSLYFRYVPNTIESEVNKYSHLWKIKKQKTENKNEYNIPEYRTFKIVSLVKEYGHSLQHLTWNEIQQTKDILLGEHKDVVSKNTCERNQYEIITIVRNPYDRVVSDLLFNHIINEQTMANPQFVNAELKKYLVKNDTYDNHKLPQYMYIIDEMGKIIDNITILRTETLTNDMKLIGFADFNCNLQTSKCSIEPKETKYISLLNQNSITLINNYYKRDFELFGYKMLA